MGILSFGKKTESKPTGIQKKKILVVEDDQYTREFYQELLSDAGYDITTAANGQEGLDKATEVTPDLILLDIMMPDMDGITVFNKLKSTPVAIPVIFLTNAGNSNNLLQAIEGKAADFLIKANTEPEYLLKRIKVALHETM